MDSLGPAPSSQPDLRRGDPLGDWLGGARAALAPTFDVDAETAVLAEGEHHVRDMSTMSHQAYGPRVGVPRILDMLDRLALHATFFVPGQTAERWPDVVERIVAGGHEVGLHGHTHRRLPEMTAAEQREDFERALEALRTRGVEPRGFRAPYWQLTRPTLDLLLEHGIRYDASLMDDDRPYRLIAPGGELAELPVHWSLDDWEQYAYLPDPDIGSLIEPPAKLVEIWSGELDAMCETGSLLLLTCHPFLSGRPSRVRALERFLASVRERDDVRTTTTGELADAVLGTSGGAP